MPNPRMMAAGLIKAWESFGATIDKITTDTIYVTVPAESDQLDAHGTPMAGKHLAKRFQANIDALTGGRKYTIKFKTRR